MNKNKKPGLLMIGVGTHLTSMIAAGFILGFGLDYLMETTPVFMMLFGVLGFVGGIIKACEMLRRFG